MQYFVQPLNHCVWDQTAEDKETYCKCKEIVKSAQALKDVVSLVYLFPMSQLPLVSEEFSAFGTIHVPKCLKVAAGKCHYPLDIPGKYFTCFKAKVSYLVCLHVYPSKGRNAD